MQKTENYEQLAWGSLKQHIGGGFGKKGLITGKHGTSQSGSPSLCPCTHQKPATTLDVSQGKRDVQKHDGVADGNSEHITPTFPIQFIFKASLGNERNGQIGILVVFHKINKPKEETSFYIFNRKLYDSWVRTVSSTPMPSRITSAQESFVVVQSARHKILALSGYGSTFKCNPSPEMIYCLEHV